MLPSLLVPDPDRLSRKLDNPPPMLARLYASFRQRLATDPDYRYYHVFLPALLGESTAIDEAKRIVADLAANPVKLAITQDNLDNHIWCIAPRALRLAAFFTWIDRHDGWQSAERETVADLIVRFFYEYVIPVMRARIPAGHNQQFSMALCCAAAGHALAAIPETADRAAALHAYAMPKLRQVLGLMPRSGYSGEGTTYQSTVVAALVMWAGVFLDQLGETDVWTHRYPPTNAALSDTLRMEAVSASIGGLLPPWDHYGWQPITHVAPRTLWAALSGRPDLLSITETVWNRWNKAHYLAWRPDDQLWTLLYWPDQETAIPAVTGQPTREASGNHLIEVSGTDAQATVLTGWSVPAVAAATEHAPTRMRIMLAWDRCSDGLQGICRAHVNPNHLMLDMQGEPITADGCMQGATQIFPSLSYERIRQRLTDSEQTMISRQYGRLENWIAGSQQGLLGASCSIVIGDDECYFPRGGRQGQLVFEQRTPQRHTFAADAAAYYRPAYDITQMRRTVAVGAAGDVWIIDDIAADKGLPLIWRIWLRRAARLEDSRLLRLDLPSGPALTMGWTGTCDGATPIGEATLCQEPSFPDNKEGKLAWPDKGSARCDLVAFGCRVRFVTCILPRPVAAFALRQTDADTWEVQGDDDMARFSLPPELSRTTGMPASSVPDQEQHTEALCDLDEPPFALLDQTSDDVLLAALDTPAPEAWRHTTAVMQTLTARGITDALPLMLALMLDKRQNYTVHSVAAWCLGHSRYIPARTALQQMADIPEQNTSHRARWALARMS